jgi:flagellar hook-associated protein 1
LENGWASQVATLGVLNQQARAEDAAATSLYEQAQAARDQVSGVDLDREAAELIRLQQAYDATARILQVARETIQSIINII